MSKPLFDLEDFIAFASTRKGGYDYLKTFECPGAQFLEAKLGRPVSLGGDYWRFGDEPYDPEAFKPIPEHIVQALVDVPRTWEALTSRLEALR